MTTLVDVERVHHDEVAVRAVPDRDGVAEHRRLEAAPARDADTAAEVLAQHSTLTAAALTRRPLCPS